MNISNLNQIRAGNIYLEPEYGHNFYVGLTHTDIESYSYVNLYMMGTLTPRSIVNASWMDAYGVRYAVPVNSPKPESYGYFGFVYNRPIAMQKKLSFTVSGVTTYTGNFSYQAKQQMKGFDLSSAKFEILLRISLVIFITSSYSENKDSKMSCLLRKKRDKIYLLRF